MVNAAKSIYWWIGLIFTIIGLIPLFPSTWFGDWGRWLILGIGLSIIFLWAPFKVWEKTEKERVKLKQQLDSKVSNVKLVNFDNELQYEVNRNRSGLIEFHLFGELVNASLDNIGGLLYLQLDIHTSQGTFLVAKAEKPSAGYEFKPRSKYPQEHFIFSCKISDKTIAIKSWEPYIRGVKGRVTLSVLGQEIRSYEVSIAKEGKIYGEL